MSLVRQIPGIKQVANAREDAELIKDLERLFKSARDDRQQYESSWLLNMAFVYDQQWVYWNESTQRIEKPKVPRWRVLMVVNLVKGVVRTEYAKLTQQRPTAKAQPASGDPDDRDQAKVCDAILSYLDATDGSDSAHKRALLWAIVCGTGILKSYWNKDKGDEITFPDTTMISVPTQDPATGQMVDQQVEVPHPQAGQPLTTKAGDVVRLGDIETCEVSPFEFYPDPFGLTIADKNWAFTVKLRSAEYVMERFGVEVEPHEVTNDQYVEGQMYSLNSEAPIARKGVLLKEFFQRSTKKYPKGRYVVYVDDRVLHTGENPYPKAQLPFASFVHIPVPARFWGDSMVTSLIDPQKNLNKSRSQAIEHRNLMTKGKWLVAAGALPVGKVITSAPGEVIEYEPVPGVAEPVKHLDGSAIPDSYWKDVDQSTREIREVSGVHEVSNAGVPSGVTAAKAIGFLQEQDDMRLGPTAQAYEDAIAALAKIKLHLAKQFYEERRTVRIAGKDNTVKVVEFYKDDIPDEVDVRVEAGASLPKSRVARQHFVMDLWNAKMLPDLRVALRLLELGEVDGLYDKINRDINQAERENEKLKGGQQIAVEKWHNHAVHLDELNDFCKGEEYENLAQDANIKAAFDDHRAQHEQATLMAQAAAVPGGPPIGSPQAAIVARAGAPTTGAVGQGAPMPDLTQSAA